MRHGALRLCQGTLIGLLLWLGSSPATAGERDTYESAKSLAASKKTGNSWWPWGSAEPKEKAGKQSERPAETRKPRPAPLQTAADQSSCVAQENATYLRRLQACDRLRSIAQETGDQALEIQAQLLEQRAWTLYEQRVAVARAGNPPASITEETVVARKLLADTPPPGLARPGDRPLRTISARQSGSGQEE